MLSFIRPAVIILQIAALLNVQAASLPVSDLVVLENLTQLPPGWSQEIEAPANQRLRFRIAVKQENAWAFEDHVVSISTPGHVLYGHHMRQDELRRMLRPSPKATIAILNWLKDENVPDGDIEDEGDWIKFYVSTSEAEKILATKFYFYSNAVSHAKKVRTLQYSVPKNISQYIHMIQPTTRFGETVPQRSSLFSLGSAKPPLKPLSPDPEFDISFCNKTTTLQCLKGLYNIGDYKAIFNKGRSYTKRFLFC